MSGWQKLWQDPEVLKLWQEFPPLPEVVAMADRLGAGGGRRVLDIGCGLGRHTVYLAGRGFEVTATDNAPAALAACRENLGKAGVDATLIEAEMTEMAFPDEHFDGVVASHAIHHTDGKTLARIIESITQKLAPGGYLVWATPSTRHWCCGKGRETDPGTWVDEEHWEGPIPHHYCTEEELRSLLRDYDIESLIEHEYREGENSHIYWRVLVRKRGEPLLNVVDKRAGY